MEKLDIARDWLPRYTGMPLEQFGTHILLTNFADYVGRFADRLGRVCLRRGGSGAKTAASRSRSRCLAICRFLHCDRDSSTVTATTGSGKRSITRRRVASSKAAEAAASKRSTTLVDARFAC